MVVKPLPPEVGRGRFGFAEVDNQSRVIGYQEKPDRPRSNLGSLTIYLFRTEVLIARLEENARTGTTYQLYSEVLPEMVGRDRVCAFRYEGYWNYARSVDAFHQANLDLLGDEPPIRLDRWGIRTRQQLNGLGDLPPARIEKGASVIDSVVCPGVQVAGTVVRSVLSPGVRVVKGARVYESVVMHDAVVSARATVDRAVLDKGVVVGEGAQVGVGETAAPNQEAPQALASGVTLIGKQSAIPAGVRIGRNCIVYPEIHLEDWKAPELAAGASLCLSEGDRL
jgi:glucose-1-phosphate adenylyltransferase